MAGCYSASDFLIPQPPHPPRLRPKEAFVQDNEESINSGGQGRGGGEHWSLRLSVDSKGGGGLHGPAASQLSHTGPERTVGPSLTAAFDKQQAEPPRRRVSLVPASFTPSLGLGVNTSLYLFILPLFLIP